MAATDPPCTAAEAVSRARQMVGRGGQYELGTGDYNAPHEDTPWTGPLKGSDCAGFSISYAWKLKRHRPGFNVGFWASVCDDLNVNSAMEDGTHKMELFYRMPQGSMPRAGDLLCYPTIVLPGPAKQKLTFIGHVCIVEDVPYGYDPAKGYTALTVIQCHGPNGYTPGVVRTDGSIWSHHDSIWPKPEHRTWIVRPHERP